MKVGADQFIFNCPERGEDAGCQEFLALLKLRLILVQRSHWHRSKHIRSVFDFRRSSLNGTTADPVSFCSQSDAAQISVGRADIGTDFGRDSICSRLLGPVAGLCPHEPQMSTIS